MADLQALVGCVVLSLLMINTSAVLRAKLWTGKGTLWAFGNRERPLENVSALAERATRASNNMLENLVVFIGAVVAAHLTAGDPARADLGATIFFGARVLYWPCYVVGIPYLRTALWAAGVAGIFVVLSSML